MSYFRKKFGDVVMWWCGDSLFQLVFTISPFHHFTI